MSKSLSILNELMVELFNDILTIEQNALQSGGFKELSVTEIHTIDAIGMYSKKTMSEVAQELRITVGTLTTAINHLVRKGYVQRNRSEEDRRNVYISLTKRGKLAYRVHQKFHLDMIKNTISGLSNEEEEVLMNSLEKLNRFFKSHYHINN